MKNIYLDTNFLMIPAEFKVDIFREIENSCDFPYKILILDKVIDELDKVIDEQKGKNKLAAKLAKQIIETKLKEKSLNITTFSSEGVVDDILVELSNKDNIIATQDKNLKTRIKEKGGKVMILRSKKYLTII